MSAFDIMCSNCQKRICIQTENNEQIKYCPFCAKTILTGAEKSVIESNTNSEQNKPIKIALPPRPKKNTVAQAAQTKTDSKKNIARTATDVKKETTESSSKNVKFINEKSEYCCDGWIPEGYVPGAKLEPNGGNADVPIVVWAFAKNNNGKEMFKRFRQTYSLSKSKVTEENRFREFDEYLDRNAAELLKTNTLRLVRRFPISGSEEEELRNILVKKRDEYNKLSNGDFLQYVVQGLYAGKGGKLYEADINGEKKYALLYVTLLASEYGTYSPYNNKMKAQNDQLLNNIRNMASGRSSGFFGGYSSPNFFQQSNVTNSTTQIDTDPRTPIGRHRCDGLTTAVISWQVRNFSGFISPTMPTEQEINDFFRFIGSLRICQPLSNAIEQLQFAIVTQNMQTQQAITNSFQQITRSQQASFERSQAAIRSVGEYSSNLTQQRIAADNAAFDRSVRRTHEAIMGVDTYTRTDGTNVEVPVTTERVFQNTSDPSQLIGASLTADVPYGWTELQKLK